MPIKSYLGKTFAASARTPPPPPAWYPKGYVKLQFVNSNQIVFDLTKIPFLKGLIGISRLIVEVLDDQNLFTESNLANWFSNYVQFCSGGHFSERAESAR